MFLRFLWFHSMNWSGQLVTMKDYYLFLDRNKKKRERRTKVLKEKKVLSRKKRTYVPQAEQTAAKSKRTVMQS